MTSAAVRSTPFLLLCVHTAVAAACWGMCVDVGEPIEPPPVSKFFFALGNLMRGDIKRGHFHDPTLHRHHGHLYMASSMTSPAVAGRAAAAAAKAAKGGPWPTTDADAAAAHAGAG